MVVYYIYLKWKRDFHFYFFTSDKSVIISQSNYIPENKCRKWEIFLSERILLLYYYFNEALLVFFHCNLKVHKPSTTITDGMFKNVTVWIQILLLSPVYFICIPNYPNPKGVYNPSAGIIVLVINKLLFGQVGE